MPPAHHHPAATRGQIRSPSFQLLLSLRLLLFLGETRGIIHIPENYEIKPELKQPPVITFQPESYTAFYLDDISLKCEASAKPDPIYRWVKDGEVFQEDRSGVITGKEDQDLKFYQGKYRCHAWNELGTALSDEIEIITDSTPILPKEKRIKWTVNEGETTVLMCNPPNSSVTPNIHWMDKKLMHIQQSERVTIGLDGNLYFANVLISDTRNDYTCNAQYIQARTILPKEPISLVINPSNVVQKNRQPQFHQPKEQRSSKPALRGQSLTLECIPHGLPTPTVTWVRKDGSFSDQVEKMSFDRWLRFKNISESDDGEYSCVANNSEGIISHSFTVSVEAAPYWTKQPQSHLYAPGETVKLDCLADGIPTPNITWKINGVAITDTDNEPRRTVSGGTLKLTDVQFGDTAVYQCEASNNHGTSLINTYIHIVELAPQILTEDTMVYSVTEGNSTFLNCATFGSPRPQIIWESEIAGPVLSNQKMSQLTTGTLLISNVSQEDAGLYTCSVKDSNLSISAQLRVLNKTQIRHPPQDLRIIRGHPGVLQCQYLVDNELEPVIVWKKDGDEIMTSAQDDKYTVTEDGSLKITDVQKSDTGRYECVVRTTLDMDSAYGSITVVDKPDAPHSLHLSEKNHRSVSLSWTPGKDNNSPVTEYVIEELEERHGLRREKRVLAKINHFKIQDLQPYCIYSFKVAAVNEIGMSAFTPLSDPYSTPPAKPDISPENVRSESIDPESMVITWKEPDKIHHNGPGFKYQVSWRQVSGHGSHWNHEVTAHPPFIVNNTNVFTAFDVKVQAINDLGEGPSPMPVIGHSGEDLPIAAPTGVEVTQHNSTTVSVKWAAVRKESVRGHLLGYKIHLHRLGRKGAHKHHSKHKRELAMRELVREKQSWVIVVHGDMKKQELLSWLEFYSDFQLSVTAFNSKGEGPHSEPIHFSTPEGRPGTPSSFTFDSQSESSLTLYWKPPHKTNGILKGYFLYYSDEESSPVQISQKNIEASATYFILGDLKPHVRYIFTLKAFTSAGEGNETILYAYTLLDGEPPKTVNASVGETSVNLSWVPGHRQRNIGFTFYYQSPGSEWEVSEVVNSTQAFYQLQGLQPGTKYILEIRHKNHTLWNDTLITNGPVLSEVQNNFASQGWFIGLISAVVLLLLILLILCFIKRSRGGKYSVKAKEEHQVDSEAKPMKDEAFGEYRSLESSDNDEKHSISQPSLCLESKRGSDDSLAEYGDSVDIQFNEDGSFIGQYSGRKDHQVQGDHDSSGATSPNNTNMPPTSRSFSNFITGILGGN